MDIKKLEEQLKAYEIKRGETEEAINNLNSQKIRLNAELDIAKKAEKESMEKLKATLNAIGFKEDEINLSPEGLEDIINDISNKMTTATVAMDEALQKVGE